MLNGKQLVITDLYDLGKNRAVCLVSILIFLRIDAVFGLDPLFHSLVELFDELHVPGSECEICRIATRSGHRLEVFFLSRSPAQTSEILYLQMKLAH